MNKLPHKNLQGFTLVELLLVIVIMAIIMISILPLSLKYKEKTDLEATQINVESLIEFSRKQSTLNYERHQHGFTISKTENKIYYISRESESSIPVTHKNIKLPSNIQITSPSNDQTE